MILIATAVFVHQLSSTHKVSEWVSCCWAAFGHAGLLEKSHLNGVQAACEAARMMFKPCLLETGKHREDKNKFISSSENFNETFLFRFRHEKIVSLPFKHRFRSASAFLHTEWTSHPRHTNQHQAVFVSLTISHDYRRIIARYV